MLLIENNIVATNLKENVFFFSIKKSIQPTRDKQHRTDVGMTLWILDAKGLTIKPKKR